MRKLFSLVCAFLLWNARALSAQAPELKIVESDSAKSVRIAEEKAVENARKHYDFTIRSELRSCGAPVQSEPYILNVGSQEIERHTQKGQAVVIVKLSIPPEKHELIWSMETDSLPPTQKETILRCLRNPPSFATQ